MRRGRRPDYRLMCSCPTGQCEVSFLKPKFIPQSFAEKGGVRRMMKAGGRGAEEGETEAAVCDGRTSEWRARVG